MEKNGGDGIRFLNRDMIKGIAMVMMTLNHFSYLFLWEGSAPDTWLGYTLSYLGYFTAPAMIFFLVEGYSYTHSRKKYLIRLLLAGAVAQIPYSLLVTRGGSMTAPWFNMMFTLSICFCAIWLADRVKKPILRELTAVFLTWLTIRCDWGILAVVYTYLFIWAGHNRKKQAVAFAAAAFVLIGSQMNSGWTLATTAAGFAGCLLIGLSGIGLAAVCIIFFYNGKKSPRGGKALQMFFYLFYPLHLLVLDGIRIAMNGVTAG